MVAPSDRCSRSMTRASLLPSRGARVLACSPTTAGAGGFGPVNNRCRFSLPRSPSRDRLFRSVVDGDGFQPGRRQFERVALSGVVSAPDGHPRLGSNLSDQAELHQLFADFGENCAFHLVGRGQAKVLALRGGAQHHKLRIGKFDAHGSNPFSHPGSPNDPGPSPGRAPDRPRAEGAVGSRAHRATSDNDTNASFRTESQSFLTRARLKLKGLSPRSKAGRGAPRSTSPRPIWRSQSAIGPLSRNNSAAASASRKHRTFADASTNGSNRPEARISRVDETELKIAGSTLTRAPECRHASSLRCNRPARNARDLSSDGVRLRFLDAEPGDVERRKENKGYRRRARQRGSASLKKGALPDGSANRQNRPVCRHSR